ncbi:TetR/AcrR family transcriptional regulator [Nocardia terpenica]|uniref:Transcriptional regulator n=1 Tax=Nocardia terpenica TaxID=455432 RepID=A0A164M2F3_9NOCA|nr:TetR/AcrR family transcriptional regulator [Nocardia terpenica]KZM72965.1 transcriptional regulator [Nocardia terpenica]MBF6061095.1 TetR/AcrR family transcriptional regulator [Nocardia terpenica]MBF6105676.1 TetR/AcrR family transcriptional regulator [Nocardia terpenica]MBF6112854.1 TetR/AcrR family transcriptional regulator [Nocardia terpenica]MBF6118984.1 TetR/AcrR family transcriptional regulator [Nocardia terpenica]
MSGSSRERIIDAALRLFGERGFAGTTIVQIEQAAGLSGGSGALYRHFRSKDELLVEAMRSRLGDRSVWGPLLDPDFSVVKWLESQAPDGSTVDKITLLFRIGLARMDHDRDINRILLRDNSIAPEVREVFRRDEYLVFVSAVRRALTEMAGPDRDGEDWEAAAAVVVGTIAHYWLISDTFHGQHPTSVDPDRYLRAVAEMTVAQLNRAHPEGDNS